MKKINFKDLPLTETPINSNNLNLLQDNIEEAIENYSLDEQVIGTWLGKPLYCKVVTYNNTETIGVTNNISTVSIPHNISNIGLVVDHKLIMSKSNNIQYMFPAYNGDSAVKKGTVISEIHSTTVLMRIINDTWGAGKTFYILLFF